MTKPMSAREIAEQLIKHYIVGEDRELRDLEEIEIAVRSHLPRANDFEIGAAMSLAHSIGVVDFSHSAMVREFLRGDKVAAGEAFSHWTMENGEEKVELLCRRLAEGLVFFGQSTANAIAQAKKDFPAAEDLPTISLAGDGISDEA